MLSGQQDERAAHGTQRRFDIGRHGAESCRFNRRGAGQFHAFICLQQSAGQIGIKIGIAPRLEHAAAMVRRAGIGAAGEHPAPPGRLIGHRIGDDGARPHLPRHIERQHGWVEQHQPRDTIRAHACGQQRHGRAHGMACQYPGAAAVDHIQQVREIEREVIPALEVPRIPVQPGEAVPARIADGDGKAIRQRRQHGLVKLRVHAGGVGKVQARASAHLQC